MAMAAAPATTRAAMAAGWDLKAALSSVCSASPAEEEADSLADCEELAPEEAGELEAAAEDDAASEVLEATADEEAAEDCSAVLLAAAELLAPDSAADEVGAMKERELIYIYNNRDFNLTTYKCHCHLQW